MVMFFIHVKITENLQQCFEGKQLLKKKGHKEIFSVTSVPSLCALWLSNQPKNGYL